MDNMLNSYDIPDVLLLGSGLDQAYGGLSWNAFLAAIAKQEYADENKIKSFRCAEPLKAVLITGDTVDKSLKDKRNILMQTVQDESYISELESILKMGFDDILTTNYTYELESVALSPKTVNDRNIRFLRKYTKKKERYYLNTYNEVASYNKIRVWHVHGEASCPGGMILGHYYYGILLSKIHKYLENKKNHYAMAQREKTKINYDSWIDSFIMGDVYVVGFGFGLSELDFWWLLNRKAREKATTGKVYFYEPKPIEDSEKQMLLKTLKNRNGQNLVEIIDMNYKMKKQKSDNNKKEEIVIDGDWKDFYHCVLDDIKTKINIKTKGENQNG